MFLSGSLGNQVSGYNLNSHPEDIVHRWKVTLAGDDPETVEEVVDGRGVVVVGRRLRPEAVLKPDVVPQPLHRAEQVRRDVGDFLASGEIKRMSDWSELLVACKCQRCNYDPRNLALLHRNFDHSIVGGCTEKLTMS